MPYPIILTGTINSNVYNNLGTIFTDCSQRLSQYETAITRYITESTFDKIVFIENSNYNFNFGKFEKLAKEYNKEFEFIKGGVYVDEITKYGKSFGDGKLIYEAICNSKILKDESTIYKCTGRIFLLNSKQICKSKDKAKNEFIIYSNRKWCLTNFFKFNKNDYMKYLANVYYECDDGKCYGLEQAFYKHISESKINIGSFNVYPKFTGEQGLTGNKYTGSNLEMFMRNAVLKLGGFTLNSKFNKLLDIFIKIKHKN